MAINNLAKLPEFRQQVINYIKSGHTIKEAIDHFQISRAAVYIYMKKANFKYVRKTVLNPEEARAYVELNPYLKMSEYARHFGISQTNMPKIMKRYGIVIKLREY